MPKIIFMLVFLLICSCSKNKNVSTILASDSSGDSVSQILENSSISAYRDENRLWELQAQKIVNTTEDNKIHANPVRLTIFNDSSVISAVLTADSGISNAKTDSLFVWGNVRINATSGEKLSGRTLEWNKNKKLLLSDDIVEISTADGEVIRGRGFRAAEDFEWWDFANEVSGNFPSVQAELEK